MPSAPVKSITCPKCNFAFGFIWVQNLSELHYRPRQIEVQNGFWLSWVQRVPCEVRASRSRFAAFRQMLLWPVSGSPTRSACRRPVSSERSSFFTIRVKPTHPREGKSSSIPGTLPTLISPPETDYCSHLMAAKRFKQFHQRVCCLGNFIRRLLQLIRLHHRRCSLLARTAS